MAAANPATSRTRSGSRPQNRLGRRFDVTRPRAAADRATDWATDRAAVRASVRRGRRMSAAVGAQAVAGPAHGLDGVAAEWFVDLAAQGGDVDVDDVGAQVGLAVPDLVEDLVASDALPGSGQEQGEDVELPRGQFDLGLASEHPPPPGVQQPPMPSRPGSIRSSTPPS